MVVCALSDEDLEPAVLRGKPREMVAHLLLAHRGGQVVFTFVDIVRRNIRIEVVQRTDPYSFEHAGYILLRMGEIAECSHVSEESQPTSLVYADALRRPSSSELSLISILTIHAE